MFNCHNWHILKTLFIEQQRNSIDITKKIPDKKAKMPNTIGNL